MYVTQIWVVHKNIESICVNIHMHSYVLKSHSQYSTKINIHLSVCLWVRMYPFARRWVKGNTGGLNKYLWERKSELVRFTKKTTNDEHNNNNKKGAQASMLCVYGCWEIYMYGNRSVRQYCNWIFIYSKNQRCIGLAMRNRNELLSSTWAHRQLRGML